MDGSHLSLRFKHGLHTIFLFVDPLQPVSAMTAQLLDVLRERYPEGELQSTQGPTAIPGPDDDETRIVYAKLRNAADPAEGWQRLELKGADTPSRKGITDGMVLGFAVVREGDDEDAEFAVDWPSAGDDLEEADDTLGPA